MEMSMSMLLQLSGRNTAPKSALARGIAPRATLTACTNSPVSLVQDLTSPRG